MRSWEATLRSISGPVRSVSDDLGRSGGGPEPLLGRFLGSQKTILGALEAIWGGLRALVGPLEAVLGCLRSLLIRDSHYWRKSIGGSHDTVLNKGVIGRNVTRVLRRSVLPIFSVDGMYQRIL